MLLKLYTFNIFKELYDYDKFCVVFFWGEWCGPCAKMRPVMEDLAGEYAGKVKMCIIDVDGNPGPPKYYRIKGMPTILFFRHGKPVNKIVGIKPKDYLQKAIQEYLESPDKINESTVREYEAIVKENKWNREFGHF